MRPWLLLAFLLLTACVSRMVDGGRGTVDGGRQTVVYLTSTPTFTPAPSPTSTLVPTPTLTPTPTPTPLPHPAAFDEAFARGLIRYESGQWLVSAHQTVGSGRETVELLLLPDTFSTHDDLRAKNPLAPYTVRALDENGQPVTLIWRPDAAEFRLAYTFPALFEGIGTEKPRLIAENLEKVPFIPIEDVQSGLAAQSVLLAMSESGYQPFTEESAQNFGAGYLLRFTMPDNNLKLAELTAYSIHGKNRNLNNLIIKMSPYWIRTQIGENFYDIPASFLLNPKDPQNPSPDEFLVVFGIPFGKSGIMSPSPDFYRFKTFDPKHPLWTPSRFFLYAQRQDGQPLDPHSSNLVESLLAQLLSIEGNDASKMEWEGAPTIDLQVNINHGINHIDSSNSVAEIPFFPDTAPSKLQQMIFLFEVGVTQ